MPCYSPTGQLCTKDDAYTGGHLRPGYRHIAEDGEHIGFDLAFRDAAPAARAGIFLRDGEPGSFDAAIKSAIESAAKSAGQKPSEWMGAQGQRGLEKLIETTAKAYAGSLASKGFSAALNLDHGRALSAARYQEDAYQASRAALNAWRGQDGATSLNEDASYEQSKVALNAWREGGAVAALRHLRHGE